MAVSASSPRSVSVTVHACFAGAVGRHVRNDADGVNRADVDDVARVTPDHVRQEAAGHPHQADQVGLDDAGPVVRRADIEACPAADVMSGVVDEDVDRLEGVRNEIGQAIGGFPVCNIKLDRERVVAQLSGELT
jgi:hypothetical protein